MRGVALTAVTAAAALMLSACGSGARQDAHERSGRYAVQVSAQFPTDQRLSQHSHMVVTVRNVSNKTIPDVAITITDPPWGTDVQPFGRRFTEQDVAYHSRPVWIIDREPGVCGYSCQGGGAGASATSYANTWALGALEPNATATFDWGVTAVTPGHFTVAYRVAAGLNGKARAVLQGGGVPSGKFQVTISGRPVQAYVNNTGQLVAPDQTPLPSGASSPDAPAGAASGRPATGPPLGTSGNAGG